MGEILYQNISILCNLLLKSKKSIYFRHFITMAETFSLAWDDYQACSTSLLRRLLEDRNFTDVTLVCEDGQLVQAHRVVLGSCSKWFNKVLLGLGDHPRLVYLCASLCFFIRLFHRPLLFLRGVQSEQLGQLLQFVYRFCLLLLLLFSSKG